MCFDSGLGQAIRYFLSWRPICTYKLRDHPLHTKDLPCTPTICTRQHIKHTSKASSTMSMKGKPILPVISSRLSPFYPPEFPPPYYCAGKGGKGGKAKGGGKSTAGGQTIEIKRSKDRLTVRIYKFGR